VEVRAYNDGIAFRHVAPGEGTRVPDEATAFRRRGQRAVVAHLGKYEALYRGRPWTANGLAGDSSAGAWLLRR